MIGHLPGLVQLFGWMLNDASTITLNGSNVSQWRDKSGNARHVAQASAAAQPTYTLSGLNGKPALDWGTAGNSRGLVRAGMTGYSPVRYFGVAEYDGPNPFNNYYGLVSHSYNTANDLFITNNGGQDWYVSAPSFLNGGASSPVALPTISAPFVFATNFAQSANRPEIFIGRDRNFSGRGWIGKISEIISVDILPSTADRQLIEGYLAWKWGLTNNLPANHPYKWNGREFGAVNITDTDAQTYIAAVETADGQSLENNTRLAIQSFIVGAKADGIWDAIKSSNILAGARTLNGALVPLKGTAPTNFNFVSDDYNRKTGLVGNGTTKYLNSNRKNNADPQDNCHAAVYGYYTGDYGGIIGSGANSTAARMIQQNNVTSQGFKANNSAITSLTNTPSGFLGVSRLSPAQFVARSGNNSTTLNETSATPTSESITVFRRGSILSTGLRLSFYSIGESLDLELLDNRVTQLMTDLGNAIP